MADDVKEMVLLPIEMEEELLKKKIPQNTTTPKEEVREKASTLPVTKKSDKDNLFSRKAIIDRITGIVLPLALNRFYDEQFRLKKANGSVIENSNLATLVEHAITPDKALLGEEEFIECLVQANVNPKFIINSNFRLKMIELMKNKDLETKTEAPKQNKVTKVSTKPMEKIIDNIEANSESLKRKAREEEHGDVSASKHSKLDKLPDNKNKRKRKMPTTGSLEPRYDEEEPIKKLKPNWDIPL